MKPMLFNTEMVRAILAGRKMVTRRVVKPMCLAEIPSDEKFFVSPKSGVIYWSRISRQLKIDGELVVSPYRPGDILYVRETWRAWRARRYEADIHIEFKAGGDGAVLQFQNGYTDSINRNDYDEFFEKWGVGTRWHPSIHMPKEAARIFLRVTGVRVERLQDITITGLQEEGALPDGYISQFSACTTDAFKGFQTLWDSTIKPAELTRYGWEADPWVWVIEFERITKEETEA